MSTSGVGSFAASVESILATALQKVGLTSGTAGAGSPPQADSSQLSPLGQVLSTLQQLQQSNPGEYKKVTQQIAAGQQTAAQTAQSTGNTIAANELNGLSSDFTNASSTGQLPNIADLAQALSGGGHHHHHAHAAGSSDSTTDQTDNTTNANTTNPLSIIVNALSPNSVTNSGTTTGNS